MVRALRLVILTLAIACCAQRLAAAQTATLVFPANGATSVDLTQPMQWTSVGGATAYYLYVGTTVGAKDLVNTGEILQTSYLAGSAPIGQTLYARLWTKSGGVWRFVDSTFSAATSAAPIATLTSPADVAVNVDLSQTIQWTTVAAAQAYYLYMGTTVGAKDVVDSGELHQTSYAATATVGGGQLVYARLWTKAGDVWRYADSTFTTLPVAKLTNPLNNAVNVNVASPMTWGSVPNAQAYYLYVGTTFGTKNLIDTGEIAQTTYPASTLAGNQTVYARLWTKFGGVWRSVDSSFSTAPIARVTYPADGAQNANLSQAIQWSSVVNVQAYYLYVGTSLGANDIVNSGETQATSYLAGSVPTGQTLYARLWTKVGGVWRSADTTFTAAVQAPVTATITYPANGAANADLSLPVQWTTVANAQAYYLYLGTTAGAADVTNSGELHQTSFAIGTFPTGQTLYARIWTKVGGVWRYTDSTFSAANLTATLIYPADGAANVSPEQPATWTSVPNVEVYYLYVGSTLGAKDIVDSIETPLTSTSLLGIPSAQTLYARLWTRVAGVWRYRDSTFTAAPIAPVFVYPIDGATNVDVAQAFSWLPPAASQKYKLEIGSTPGSHDLFDSGEISSTSVVPSGLAPTGDVMYARVWSQIGGEWARHSDIAFTTVATGTSAAISIPVDGDTAFDAGRAFEWSSAPLGRAYRLTIGTTVGGTDLHDSGEIHVLRRFVPNLPAGTPLHGRLYTKIDGQWLSNDFNFTATSTAASSVAQMKSVLWAADWVRSMSDIDDRPYGWTELLRDVGPRYVAVCSDFSATLLRMLGEMNVSLQARALHIAFDTNSFDSHTLVEVLDPVLQRWVLIDPTFDMQPKRVDGTGATAEDLSQAAFAFDWASITFDVLSDAGDAYARAYYIDYPQLFANVFHEGQSQVIGQGNSPLPFLQEDTMPAGTPGVATVFAVQCLNGATNTTIVKDTVDTQVECNGIDGLSPAFSAGTVDAPSGGQPAFRLYRLRRFVF